MICRSIVAASIVFSLAVVPTTAQQAFDPSTVAPNPLVEGLLRSTPDGGAVVELQGFVGPSTADTVRLYSDLTLRSFTEIPRAAILQQVAGAAAGSSVKLYVPGSTVVVIGARVSADSAAGAAAPGMMASTLARMLPGAVQSRIDACSLACSYCPGGLGGIVTADIACAACIYCYATSP